MSADGIVFLDGAQRITFFNEGAEGIFGYSKAEVLGKHLDLLIPERLRAVHREHVNHFVTGNVNARRMGDRVIPILGLKKTGEEFPAEVAISKLTLGTTVVLTATIRDVTDRKHMEAAEHLLARSGSGSRLTSS